MKILNAYAKAGNGDQLDIEPFSTPLRSSVDVFWSLDETFDVAFGRRLVFHHGGVPFPHPFLQQDNFKMTSRLLSEIRAQFSLLKFAFFARDDRRNLVVFSTRKSKNEMPLRHITNRMWARTIRRRQKLDHFGTHSQPFYRCSNVHSKIGVEFCSFKKTSCLSEQNLQNHLINTNS